jgi:hypothetical protein
VALAEGLVEVCIAVVAHVADAVAAELDDDTGALIDDIGRSTFQPAAFADLDDDAIAGLVPVAPDVFVTLVGGAETELAIGECAQHRVAPAAG